MSPRVARRASAGNPTSLSHTATGQATQSDSVIVAGVLSCRQRDIDRYGRIVGQCFLPDGRDITAAMIASGTAQEFCRYSGNHYGTC